MRFGTLWHDEVWLGYYIPIRYGLVGLGSVMSGIGRVWQGYYIQMGCGPVTWGTAW